MDVLPKNVGAVDRNAESAFHLAANQGWMAHVEKLLAIDPHLTRATTALHLAVQSPNNEQMIATLFHLYPQAVHVRDTWCTPLLEEPARGSACGLRSIRSCEGLERC